MKLTRFVKILSPKNLTLLLIRLYRTVLSPYLGNNCRFYPSCSAYAAEAIDKKGLTAGIVLSAWRIVRCNPLSKGGHDPVR